MINLTKISETNTSITLGWTPVVGAIGYKYTVDGKVSHTWNGATSSVKVSKSAQKVRVEALGVEDFGDYPAPVIDPPPPTGTVRTATPGNALAQIAASSAGDTVLCTGGAHPRLVLAKDFTNGQVTVKCDAGSWFAGIDTNGKSGYLFDQIESRLPVELVDYNVSPFYLRGASQRITVRASKLSGGYDGVKVYGGSVDCTLDTVDISGVGGDCIHVNGSTNLTVTGCNLHDPVDAGNEHHDGIQAQKVDGLSILNTRISWPVTPRRDQPNNGVLIKSETGAGAVKRILVDGLTIDRWWGGRPFQLLAADDAVVKNLTIIDGGVGTATWPVTIDAFAGARYTLYGVDPARVWFNSQQGRAATTFA